MLYFAQFPGMTPLIKTKIQTRLNQSLSSLGEVGGAYGAAQTTIHPFQKG
jgi:hypothetical protein